MSELNSINPEAGFPRSAHPPEHPISLATSPPTNHIVVLPAPGSKSFIKISPLKLGKSTVSFGLFVTVNISSLESSFFQNNITITNNAITAKSKYVLFIFFTKIKLFFVFYVVRSSLSLLSIIFWWCNKLKKWDSIGSGEYRTHDFRIHELEGHNSPML